MNPSWEEAEDSDGDEDGEYESYRSEKDAVIFLIDASKEMFSTSAEESPFHMAVKCAHSTLANKIISSDKDLLAIVFFGTEKGKNSSNFKHIYEFQSLSLPGAERIQEAEELMKCSPESFKEKYGHSNQFSLSDALWTCSILFSHCKMKLDNKRLLMFTNADNPHANNNKLHQLAKSKAKDLFDLGISIDLLPIQTQGNSFDLNAFYKDIIHVSDEEVATLADPSERFEELLTRVRIKDHKKRAQASLLFTLGEGLQMGVGVYNLILPLKKPTAVKLAKSNNSELHGMTKAYLGDTGEILMPSDKMAYQEYGGKKIYLELDEVKQLKQFGEPGLLLLGFKPISYLKPHHHYLTSKFIYPNEKSMVGSTKLFSALLLQCHKRKCMAICRLIMRNNQPPKLVALVPQEEELDDHGVQIAPSGFHLYFLPFMEDIRSLPLDTRYQARAQMIEKAKEIIKKLQFTYNPESFENPVLQKHWRNIEALALNRDAPDDMIDYTKVAGVRPVIEGTRTVNDFYGESQQTTVDADITEFLLAIESSSEASPIHLTSEEAVMSLADIPLPAEQPDIISSHYPASPLQDSVIQETLLLPPEMLPTISPNTADQKQPECSEILQPISSTNLPTPFSSSQQTPQNIGMQEIKLATEALPRPICIYPSRQDQPSLQDTETQGIPLTVEASSEVGSHYPGIGIEHTLQEEGQESPLDSPEKQNEFNENLSLGNKSCLETNTINKLRIEHQPSQLSSSGQQTSMLGQNVGVKSKGSNKLEVEQQSTPFLRESLNAYNNKDLKSEQESLIDIEDVHKLRTEHQSLSSPLPRSTEENINFKEISGIEKEPFIEMEKGYQPSSSLPSCSDEQNVSEVMYEQMSFVKNGHKVRDEHQSEISTLRHSEEKNNCEERLRSSHDFLIETENNRRLRNENMVRPEVSATEVENEHKLRNKNQSAPSIEKHPEKQNCEERLCQGFNMKIENKHSSRNENEVRTEASVVEVENEHELSDEYQSAPSAHPEEQNNYELRLCQESLIEIEDHFFRHYSRNENGVIPKQISAVEVGYGPKLRDEHQSPLSMAVTSEEQLRLCQESLIEIESNHELRNKANSEQVTAVRIETRHELRDEIQLTPTMPKNLEEKTEGKKRLRSDQESLIEIETQHELKNGQQSTSSHLSRCTEEQSNCKTKRLRLDHESHTDVERDPNLETCHPLLSVPLNCSKENEPKLRSEHQSSSLPEGSKHYCKCKTRLKAQQESLLKIEEEEHKLRIELQKQRLQNEAELHKLEMEVALIENRYWKKMLFLITPQ